MKIKSVLVLLLIPMMAAPAFAAKGPVAPKAQEIQQAAAFDTAQADTRQKTAEMVVEQKNAVLVKPLAVEDKAPQPVLPQEEKLGTFVTPDIPADSLFDVALGGKVAFLRVMENYAYPDHILAARLTADYNYVGPFYDYDKQTGNIFIGNNGSNSGVVQVGTQAWLEAKQEMTTLLTQAYQNTTNQQQQHIITFSLALLQHTTQETDTNFSAFGREHYQPANTPSRYEVNRVENTLRVVNRTTSSGIWANTTMNLQTLVIGIGKQAGDGTMSFIQPDDPQWRPALNDLISTLIAARSSYSMAAADRNRLTATITYLQTL